MKKIFYLAPMVFLLLLVGCSSVPSTNPDSLIAAITAQPTSPVENTGYLYLRLGNKEAD